MLFEASSGTVLGGVAVVGDVPMRETVSCLTDTVLAVYPKVLLSEVATVDSDEVQDESLAYGGSAESSESEEGLEQGGHRQDAEREGSDEEDAPAFNPVRNTILIKIALATARAMTPVIRRFLGLGMQRQLLRNGDELYGANDPAKAMWLVISGRLRTFQVGESAIAREKSIRLEVDVGRGQSVGEVAMFASTVASSRHGSSHKTNKGGIRSSRGRGDAASSSRHKGACVAIRDTELVRLSHFSFMQLCDMHPRSILEITASLARRLQQDRLLTSRCRNYATICVVPSGASSGENFELVAGFAANLATAFEAEGHLTQLISSQKLETYLGPGSGGVKLDDFFFREQVCQWLIDQEEIYTYQVMLADASSTAWTQLCIRQADCILCVADARDSPALSDVENSLLFLKSKDGKSVDPRSPRRDSTVYTQQQARKELVLLHRGDPATLRRPRNTRRWFKDRPSIREHHHVRWRVEVSCWNIDEEV
jgi:lysophospholipid hydrolase